jgi:hypothetical protein
MREFDYGADENQKRYGTEKPPELTYEGLSVPVAIFGGKHDAILSTKNIESLMYLLPKGQVIFSKLDYELDHGGFTVSNTMPHMEDTLQILKDYQH